MSPNAAADRAAALTAWQNYWPGVAVEEQDGRFRVLIPDRFRISHEEHFALVTRRFLDYVRNPKELPAWEKPNMLAKYYMTTKGVELARKHSTQP